MGSARPRAASPGRARSEQSPRQGRLCVHKPKGVEVTSPQGDVLTLELGSEARGAGEATPKWRPGGGGGRPAAVLPAARRRIRAAARLSLGPSRSSAAAPRGSQAREAAADSVCPVHQGIACGPWIG